MPSLFKGPLQSLCRTHCALTTIALVCALVLGSSFLWLSAVSSCPFHSVSTLHFHAPPVLRKGTRKHAPHHDCLNLTLFLSCIIPPSPSSVLPHLLSCPHYYKDREQKEPLFIVHFCSGKGIFIFIYSYQF